MISALLSDMCSGRYLETSTTLQINVPKSRNVSREETRRFNANLKIGLKNLLQSLQNFRFGSVRPRSRAKDVNQNAEVDKTSNSTVFPPTNSSVYDSVTNGTYQNLTRVNSSGKPTHAIRTCNSTVQKASTRTRKTTEIPPISETIKVTSFKPVPTTTTKRPHHRHRHRIRHGRNHRGHRNYLVGCRRLVFHDEESLCRTVCSKCQSHMLLKDYILCIPHCFQAPRGRNFHACLKVVWHHHFCS